MRKFSILVFGLLLSINGAFATRYVTHTYQTPNYNPSIYNQANVQDMNNTKLSQVEQSLYGRTFESQNPNARLNRLEESVFSRTYPNVPFDQRMNNLIMHYNNNFQNNYSQVSNKSSKIDNLINGLSNMFYGVPTGMTPQVQPYYDDYNSPDSGWGRSSSYYGRNGWRVNNRSLGGGTGIRLID